MRRMMIFLISTHFFENEKQEKHSSNGVKFKFREYTKSQSSRVEHTQRATKITTQQYPSSIHHIVLQLSVIYTSIPCNH